MYKRDYMFRMNVMEEIFEITSCIDWLVHAGKYRRQIKNTTQKKQTTPNTAKQN